MKTVENNVKFGENIIFDQKFYVKATSLLQILSPRQGFCRVPGVGFSNERFSDPRGQSEGMVTGQGDTCIVVCNQSLPARQQPPDACVPKKD